MLEKLSRELEAPGYSKNLEDCVDEANGLLAGDFYLLRIEKSLNAGRLSGHYLRFTATMFLKKDVNIKDVKTITPPANSIIVFPEGGVHFLEKSSLLFSPYPVFVISAKAGEEQVTPKTLLGLCVFLKSSFLLWYLLTIHETEDVFEFLMRSFDRLPLPSDPKLLDVLGAYGEQIINAERKVLKDLANGKLDEAQREVMVVKHNDESSATLRQADREIMKALQFSESEIRELARALGDLRVSDYAIGSNLDGFVKSVMASA